MRLALCVLATLALFCAAPHAQRIDPCEPTVARGTFAEIAVPGADSTYVTAINNRGQIVGTYSTAGVTSGFVLDRGEYTALSIPGSTTTRITDINSRGIIVGSYDDADGSHGFVWDAGTVMTLDVPDAIATSPQGINEAGAVVGLFLAPGEIDGIEHGFVFRRGEFQTVDHPDASGTSLLDINNAGSVLGVYASPAGPAYFLYTAGGFAPVPMCASNTVLVEITNGGHLIGSMPSGVNSTVGIVATGRGLTTVQAPDATLTVLAGGNAAGTLIGEYWDATNNHHSFAFVPSRRPGLE